ncbi:MAG: EVE domain-containing protein [Chloroflexi bacterium]|nr:EVE domain-containing protein [Chloroflexota bacterium]
MPRNYWMLVLTPENIRVTREQGFTVQGFRTGLRRKVERMEVGDRLLFYLSGIRRFAATATIISTYFEDHSPHWKGSGPREDFPWRVKIEPGVVLEEDQFLDARLIAPRLEYVKRWTPEWWPLAFQGDLHLIPRADFSLLESEMREVATAGRRAPGPGAPLPSLSAEQQASA